jgi:hypothetical protein
VKLGGDHITLRDSKSPDSGSMRFAVAQWREFLSGIKNGQFDVS